jgi:dTDP-4-dehydrorhamnose 3,5-epimerase
LSSNLELIQTTIKDLFIIQRKIFSDHRGTFLRIFSDNELKAIGLNKYISQVNYSFTKEKGTTRGLHYQMPPMAEVKIVTCIEGEIFDVAVDLRSNSPTFLKWFGAILSENSFNSLYIPEGFAHGFQTLKENCKIIYCHTSSYSQECEAGINILDPILSIKWPLEPINLSQRDISFSFLNPNFIGITLQ